jgi:hypothetical protein
MTREAAAMSSDPVLREFASTLSDSHFVVDLSDAQPGQGFAWGRYGINSVARYGSEPVFALARKKSIFSRLFWR